MATILVIEDNHANMKLACLLLRNAGHVALCAADAETGLTLARTARPDLILMDIQLPGMDGLAATALLKQDPATAAIPVVALTAMAMKSDQEKTRVAGCDAYIAKPLRYQALYAVIDSLLDGPPSTAHGEGAPPAQAGSPASAQDANARIDAASFDAAFRDGRLILVAEDNATNRKIIGRQLALLGHVADIVDNGRAALERWRSGRYALLLSDLQMPEMDGYELIDRIRADERGLRRTPIVVMTASSSKLEADRYRTPDMDDFLGKPLQLAELKQTLDTWLPGGSARLPGFADGAAVASRAAGVVDTSVLERLVGDDPATLHEFMGEFRTSAGKVAVELVAACHDHRSAHAGMQAHKLLSSARAVGALGLGDLCAEMESAGRADDVQALAALLPLFERELGAVDAFIDALLARPVHGR